MFLEPFLQQLIVVPDLRVELMASCQLCVFFGKSGIVFASECDEVVLEGFELGFNLLDIATDEGVKQLIIRLLDIISFLFSGLNILDQLGRLPLIRRHFILEPVILRLLDRKCLPKVVDFTGISLHLGFVIDNGFAVTGILLSVRVHIFLGLIKPAGHFGMFLNQLGMLLFRVFKSLFNFS